MNSQLSRVQVYLDQQNLNIIDKISKEDRVSRSQIIRDAVENHVKKLTKRKKTKKLKKSALMEMAGIEVSKTGTVGLNVDEIYLTD